MAEEPVSISEQEPLSSTGPDKPKNNKKLLVLIVSLLALLLIGGGAYWLGTKNSKKDTKATNTTTAANEQTKNTTEPSVTDAKTAPETPKKADATCPSSPGAKTFYNKVIGLQFCYPKEWGEATVGNVEASDSVSGGAYEIRFATKDGLSITSATSDWKNTVARDGRCADPQQEAPQFSTYQPEWKTEGSGMALTSALRVHIKQEPDFLIRELADDYYSGVCLMAIVSTPGGAYNVQTVNLLRSFSGGIMSVKAHIDNPTILITAAERVQYSEMVASMMHVK